jgi:phytoene synthase
MNQKHVYEELSNSCSKATTNLYSTSFSLGILLFKPNIRNDIYSIYGFVRLADEIVDTFYDHEPEYLLKDFWLQTLQALEGGISLNPIINSFQATVKKHDIPIHLIEAFIKSMEMDLLQSEYKPEEVEEYIYGSAEVVGLMCLKVFTSGNSGQYDKLAPSAKKLGAAFQKVNFLRDLKDDYNTLGRSYFEGLDIENYSNETRQKVEGSIEQDFRSALKGIKQLPLSSRFGVYIAYIYYYSLFNKIKRLQFEEIISQRIRIPNHIKYMLLVKSWFYYKLRLV